MQPYKPELGQAVFDQPHKQFEVPEIMDAALQYIRYELGRVRWNARQGEDLCPFGNNGDGGDFKSDVFDVCAYSWGDDEQPYNFKWRELKISWYKYMGRGMSTNMEITPQMASECLNDCLNYLRQIENQEGI
jgi:hypothetical protein